MPTSISGAFLVEPEPIEDERGFFARTYCRDEFLAHGLNPDIAQCNTSFNKRRGTLRGMHYQIAPYAESKLVRCTRGAIFDVLLDMRNTSASFKQWEGFYLSENNGHMLYIPEGVAHGFQTLEDDTEVFYQMGAGYHPESACGLRWDDPTFDIRWPLPKAPVMSDRDRGYALWRSE